MGLADADHEAATTATVVCVYLVVQSGVLSQVPMLQAIQRLIVLGASIPHDATGLRVALTAFDSTARPVFPLSSPEILTPVLRVKHRRKNNVVGALQQNAEAIRADSEALERDGFVVRGVDTLLVSESIPQTFDWRPPSKTQPRLTTVCAPEASQASIHLRRGARNEWPAIGGPAAVVHWVISWYGLG